MSTQIIETNLEMMHLDLVTFINDEPLDMLDEFDADYIACEVISIARRLMFRDFCNGHIKKGKNDYLYSINNKAGGWVSISDGDTGDTGVSTTMYFPFFKDEEEGYFAGLCSLASMINEEWYHCNN